jgi:hypothetical protein
MSVDDVLGHCSKCNQDLPLRDFYRRGRGGFQAWCKTCAKATSVAASKRKVREKRGLPLDHPRMRGFRDHKPEGYTITDKRSGYVHIKATGHHRADKYGWTYEHIVIAEQRFGIKITRDFTVHHINGDRADNRPENLDLRVGNHGKHGDVIPALLRDPQLRAIARAVLAQYDDYSALTA